MACDITQWSEQSYNPENGVNVVKPSGVLQYDKLGKSGEIDLPHPDSLPQSVVVDGSRLWVSDIVNNQVIHY